MRIQHDNAAFALSGRTLKNRWHVKQMLDPSQFKTGGNFSVCYLVEDSEGVAFLKALDIKQHVSDPRIDMVTALNEATTCFLYEKNLLTMCSSRKFSKVSVILDEGEEYVENHSIPKVPFLIFELANGDVRNHLGFVSSIDIAWKLRSLHNIAVGLMQLHSIEVTHQDLKPSNVLLFEGKTTSKIGDLGRAICKNIQSPYDTLAFAGDRTYAPIEIMYGHYQSEWAKRAYLADAYTLGGMVSFYFSGMNINALIYRHLNEPFKYWNWGNGYDAVLPYMIDAFYKALDELKSNMPTGRVADDVTFIVNQLCHPDPTKRCNVYNGGKVNSLLLQKVISSFNRMAKSAELNLL